MFHVASAIRPPINFVHFLRVQMLSPPFLPWSVEPFSSADEEILVLFRPLFFYNTSCVIGSRSRRSRFYHQLGLLSFGFVSMVYVFLERMVRSASFPDRVHWFHRPLSILISRRLVTATWQLRPM